MQGKLRDLLAVTFISIGSFIILIITASKIGVADFLAVLLNNSVTFNKALISSTVLMNLVVLIIFLFSIKRRKLEFTNSKEIVKLSEILKLKDGNFRTFKYNNQRVNNLVSQIVKQIRAFIYFLILFYLIKYFEILAPDIYNKFNSHVPWMSFIETSANMISAGFIYLTFLSLYKTTLNDSNHATNYYGTTSLLITIFVVSYFLLLNVVSSPDGILKITKYYRLFGSIYNGVALGLLFGRLTSMEYYFKDVDTSDEPIQNRLISNGTTFILPLYALAQPMFGILGHSSIETRALFLESVIFLACFVGKTYFLYFLVNVIDRKWLHSYLHIVLVSAKSSMILLDTISDKNDVNNNEGPDEDVFSPYLFNLAGEFEYTCTQENSGFRYGGTCTIKEVKNSDHEMEWKIYGIRMWKADPGGHKKHNNHPIPWTTTSRGIQFSERTYMYEYVIDPDGECNSGFSRGKILLSSDNSEVIGFEGMFYLETPDGTVLGTERMEKRMAGNIPSL